MLRIYRITRLLRLLRVTKMSRKMQTTSSADQLKVGLYRILKFCIVVLFLIHFLACFYLWMGKINERSWISSKTSSLIEEGEEMDEPYKSYIIAVYFIT